MATERNKTTKALQTAIQMEIDGKEYYLKASQVSSNELGKKLLKSLASEEDTHRKMFEQIFEAIRNKKTWPQTDIHLDGGQALRTIFAKATKELGTNVKVIPDELDAVQGAMAMENKSYDFYESQIKTAAYDAEKDYYKALAAQERKHYIVLLDYYEYLKDPAAWFVEKEHPSLDGG